MRTRVGYRSYALRLTVNEWVFIPSSREYAVPWLIGLTLFPVLGTLNTSAVARPEFLSHFASVPRLLAACLLLLVFNGVLLWAKLRSQFATWQTGRQIFYMTLALLVITYSCVWGLTALARGVVVFAPLSSARLDLGLTLWSMGIGMTGLLPALLLSVIWKLEDPGLAAVRLIRGSMIDIVIKLRAEKVTRNDYDVLLKGLSQLSSAASETVARLNRSTDREVVSAWADAASALDQHFLGMDFADERVLILVEI